MRAVYISTLNNWKFVLQPKILPAFGALVMNKDHFLYFLSIKIRMIDAAITEPIKIPRAISVIIHSPSPDHLLFLATL